MDRNIKLIAGLTIVFAVVTITIELTPERFQRHGPAKKVKQPSPLLKPDALYTSGQLDQAASAYRAYIAANANSKDANVQDQVENARISLGYVAAKKKDFKGARAILIEASMIENGTGLMDPAYGTLPEQAAFEAIVCLSADGKKDQAKGEFLKFIKERPYSPLINSCFKRYRKLCDNNEELDAANKVFQHSLNLQQLKGQFEQSVCGPKALVYLLEKLGKGKQDYEHLAKLCGTKTTGTTMAGMQQGLKAFGLQARGYSLNRKDLDTLKPPAIWLQNGHYYVLTSIVKDQAVVFDPTHDSKLSINLPPVEDINFTATVLSVTKPGAIQG